MLAILTSVPPPKKSVAKSAGSGKVKSTKGCKSRGSEILESEDSGDELSGGVFLGGLEGDLADENKENSVKSKNSKKVEKICPIDDRRVGDSVLLLCVAHGHFLVGRLYIGQILQCLVPV
ncbi:MAG: hypothetical protein MMC33_009629 [Icmadophila ericetorum]|nr:hypothetical protein [Icmadophila ericetorum]